jgi:phosphoribosylanthranilate isomerase
MTFVKFCGLTRQRDVDVACALGVDAVGFVLWPKSPRFIDLEGVGRLVRSLPDTVMPVGVFVRPSRDEIESAAGAGIRVAQIHGVEPGVAALEDMPMDRWIAASVDADLSAVPDHTRVLLDVHDPEKHGGTGRTIEWSKAAAIATRWRVLLAGGLNAGNVRVAIRQVQPFGVDVSSGIEERPGIKDAQAMRAFVAAVRETDQ